MMDISAHAVFSVAVSNDVIDPKLYLDTCTIFNFPTAEHMDLCKDMYSLQYDDNFDELVSSLAQADPLLSDIRSIPATIAGMEMRLRFNNNSSGLYHIIFPVGVVAEDVTREEIECLLQSKSKEELSSFLKKM